MKLAVASVILLVFIILGAAGVFSTKTKQIDEICLEDPNRRIERYPENDAVYCITEKYDFIEGSNLLLIDNFLSNKHSEADNYDLDGIMYAVKKASSRGIYGGSEPAAGFFVHSQ